MPGTGPTPNAVLANTPTIENVAMPSTIGQEQSYTFPPKTRKFTIKGRLPQTLKIAFAANQTGTKWFTVPPGGYWLEDNLDLSGKTVFMQSDKASGVVEILSWQRV